MRYNVAVIGLGFVGLSLASFIGSNNAKVTGIDYDKEKLQKIRNGNPHFYEPKLKYYLRKSLNSGLILESEITERTMANDFIFLTVGTPTDKQGKIDLSQVKSVVLTISKKMSNLKKKPSIIVKSTVIPGTTMNVIKPILERNSLRESIDFDLLTNPEFLREGSAINDTIHPHVIVIGGSNNKSIKKLTRLYDKIYQKKQPIIETNNVTAELIKYANNTFLATKISFINSIANICQKIKGANIDDVALAIGMDPRIGNLFLKAGPGYGGSCFPKDVRAFINFSNEIGHTPLLFNATQEINSLQVQRIIEIIKQNIHTLKNKKIGILGLSFKENTDDIRESVSIKLIDNLLKNHCNLTVHDPQAMKNTYKIFRDKITYCENPYDVFNDADCVILLTPWDQYKKLNEVKFPKMKYPLIIDTRRILRINNPKIKYIGFGIGN